MRSKQGRNPAANAAHQPADLIGVQHRDVSPRRKNRPWPDVVDRPGARPVAYHRRSDGTRRHQFGGAVAALRFDDGINQFLAGGAPDAFLVELDPNFVDRRTPMGGEGTAEELLRYLSSLRATFSDLPVTFPIRSSRANRSP